jgi:hypothetical protein
MSLERAVSAIVTVGVGRGFVVPGRPNDRLIVTAAHCLPSIPSCASLSPYEERIFHDLVAPLGHEPAVSVECLFVDTIADIAILGPDDPEAFFGLVENAEPLKISKAQEGARAFILSLRNRWFSCIVRGDDGPLMVARAELPIVDGMSGSPILDESGRAIGMVCVSNETRNRTEGGCNPQLMDSRPGWYLRQL